MNSDCESACGACDARPTPWNDRRWSSMINDMPSAMHRTLRPLTRGLRRRCPRCGCGRLFAQWYTLHDRCPDCDLDFEETSGNTWAFMYLSTAFLTGLIVVAMLFVIRPSHWASRAVVLPLALVVILGSLPYRKGFAIGIEFLIERHWGKYADTAPDDDRDDSYRDDQS